SLGLAPLIARQIFSSIKQLNEEERLTVFLVEQNAFHALRLAHRAYVMVNGRITMSGSGRELLARPEVSSAYLEGGSNCKAGSTQNCSSTSSRSLFFCWSRSSWAEVLPSSRAVPSQQPGGRGGTSPLTWPFSRSPFGSCTTLFSTAAFYPSTTMWWITRYVSV